MKKLLLLLALIPASASAHDLAKALSKEPVATYVSNKPLFEVERCLIMLDTPNVQVVYRTPDRPDHSLVYWNSMVVELVRADNQTRIVVRNHATRGFERKLEARTGEQKSELQAQKRRPD